MSKIGAGDFNFEHPVWNERSKYAQQFVSWLLNVNSEKRPDAKRASRHRWLFRKSGVTTPGSSASFDPVICRFNDMLKEQAFQRKTMNYLAFQCTIADIRHLREELNEDSSARWGFISSSGFKNVLENCGYPENLIAQIFSDDDSDGGGFEFEEFLNHLSVASGRIVEIQLVQVFDAMGSKDVSRGDIQQVLGTDFDDLHVKDIFDNSNERISFPQFLHLFDRHLPELFGLTSPPTHLEAYEGGSDLAGMQGSTSHYTTHDPVMEDYSGYIEHTAIDDSCNGDDESGSPSRKEVRTQKTSHHTDANPSLEDLQLRSQQQMLLSTEG
jgi:Ca2+-binding EF-hand superfamily protein